MVHSDASATFLFASPPAYGASRCVSFLSICLTSSLWCTQNLQLSFYLPHSSLWCIQMLQQPFYLLHFQLMVHPDVSASFLFASPPAYGAPIASATLLFASFLSYGAPRYFRYHSICLLVEKHGLQLPYLCIIIWR